MTDTAIHFIITYRIWAEPECDRKWPNRVNLHSIICLFYCWIMKHHLLCGNIRYAIWSSLLCSILYSSLLGPNILLMTQSSNSVNLCSVLRIQYQKYNLSVSIPKNLLLILKDSFDWLVYLLCLTLTKNGVWFISGGVSRSRIDPAATRHK